eukprot:15447178-Alexandrium_andersonii.AAC.1
MVARHSVNLRVGVSHCVMLRVRVLLESTSRASALVAQARILEHRAELARTTSRLAIHATELFLGHSDTPGTRPMRGSHAWRIVGSAQLH